MENIFLFSINDYQFSDLVIIDYKIKTEVLDSEGTARTLGVGWKMLRFPEGVIINMALRVGSKKNNTLNKDFTRLLRELNDFGKVDFKLLTITSPFDVNDKITQYMYAPGYEASMQRIRKNGVTYWNPIDIQFIAQEAYIK